ncbi:MAG: recombinase family protein [Lachnospiraceae bacterium]|nr:recombinase family protein [Lachnospiraceae bacterium]
MDYGYARISTPKQNIERQVRNILKEYPDAHIVKEVYTGTKFQGRKEFDRILKTAKSGDRIIFDSVSRMSRTAEEGFALYKILFSRNIELAFLKEPHINTATYKQAVDNQLDIAMDSGDKAADALMEAIITALNKYMLVLAEKQIQLAFEQSEKEVADLHQRTREGMETARLNGKQIGQKAGIKLTTKKSVISKEKIIKYSRDFGGTLNDSECIKLIGISRGSYYKYKRELRQGCEK